MTGPLRSKPNVLGWIGLAALGVLFAYLSFRHSTEMKTVPWIPRPIGNSLDGVIATRNLWGFGLLGAYCAIVLGVRPFPPQRLGGWFALAVLLALPVGKELSQTFIDGRHCNASGMLQGVLGMTVGLVLGSRLRKRAPHETNNAGRP